MTGNTSSRVRRASPHVKYVILSNSLISVTYILTSRKREIYSHEPDAEPKNQINIQVKTTRTNNKSKLKTISAKESWN
uniref:AlNc14C146G7400 protein n=1 Tax=Albugo laibachii Nc14 TaxID=890382 RepID=F0WLL2_9STRA|nr:AlNc14C146G7400 [Albugo laibachii Nc14]|eukprot:CCA22177.1 AlNc14C146G7400 [Albugo laibachii Nc14]